MQDPTISAQGMRALHLRWQHEDDVDFLDEEEALDGLLPKAAEQLKDAKAFP